MTRLQQTQSLLSVSKQQLSKIEKGYNSSLHKKLIDPNLQILIKNYLENLRSILDYLAKEISESILQENKKNKIYFPITRKNQSFNDFKSLIGKYLPGLDCKRKDIFDELEKIQPYHTNHEWLADFATLTNDNKHQNLTPQIKKEIPSLTISHKEAGIKLSGGASISIERGASISIGGARIDGGQRIFPDSSYIAGDPRLNVKKEIWVDFIFKSVNKSALGFLRQAYSGIEKINSEISSLL